MQSSGPCGDKDKRYAVLRRPVALSFQICPVHKRPGSVAVDLYDTGLS